MCDQRGMTLTELVTTMAIMSIVAAVTIAYSLPLMARETVRAAAHDAHAALQLTKIEASSRNRPCRFVVDTAAGALEVWDSRGTGTTSDDLQLHRALLPASVAFARPDTGGAVTLSQIGSSDSYQSIVGPDGVVSAGTGQLHLLGGGKYSRVSVHAAGGVELSHWNGAQWYDGS
ncbi:MAG: prepilin-type N-terminal cleavage/methylation domain-containing protein [bacterium]|nr:prepilin-type N-terminal cleavage/methylation domain-containing protein [bacterium]